jgi:hypothetical protein
MRHLTLSVLLLAWVLWSQTLPTAGSDPAKATWQVVESMTVEADCRRQAAQRERQERLNLTGSITFHCHPDTIDPRPQK